MLGDNEKLLFRHYAASFNVLYVNGRSSMPVLQDLSKLFYSFVECTTIQDAFVELDKSYFHLLIIEFKRDEEISAFCTKAKKKKPEPYIILLDDTLDMKFACNAIQTGVDEYIDISQSNKHHVLALLRTLKQLQNNKKACAEMQYFHVLTNASIVSKSDIDGNITYVNKKFCDITGYAEEELIGKNHSIFRHPSTPDSLYKDMWQTILSGKMWRERVTNLKKDGSTYTADTTIIPLHNDEGKIIEFIAIRNDVTKLIELNKKIFKEKQEAEKQRLINKAKESFLILFTHELKTPLNAIINFSQYISMKLSSSEKPDRGKLSKLSESIHANAADMLQNVTNILDISKIKTHNISYNKQPVILKSLCNDVLQKHATFMEKNGYSVLTDFVSEGLIISDAFRISQILNNIISNAIKYGKNKIMITTLESEECVTITIEDNGNGIKNKEKVFELYEQEDDSVMNRSSKGTGVGLYFVKLLCHDLDIECRIDDSELLKGAKFILKFKKAKGEHR